MSSKAGQSRYVVVRLKKLTVCEGTTLLYGWCVKMRYNENARKRYNKTHGNPVALFATPVIASNFRDALNTERTRFLYPKTSLSDSELDGIEDEDDPHPVIKATEALLRKADAARRRTL